MRIVWMNGGLGNQAFQYIFMRYIEEKSGEDCIIDDIYFQSGGPLICRYQLDQVWSLHPTRLSDLLDKDVVQELRQNIWPEWPEMTRDKKSPNLLSYLDGCGTHLDLVQESDWFTTLYPNYSGSVLNIPINSFAPYVLQMSGNLYYFGWWINGHWFAEIKDVILKEFTFPKLHGDRNASLYKEMCSSDQSVAVHIRNFSDYIRERGEVRAGDLPDLDPQLYCAALDVFRKKIKNPVFYIFSDNLARVKSRLSEYGFQKHDKIIFVDGNVDGRNYIDMQLMSVCRGMIIANSSFSYLAALLNQRPDKIIANPTQREIL